MCTPGYAGARAECGGTGETRHFARYGLAWVARVWDRSPHPARARRLQRDHESVAPAQLRALGSAQQESPRADIAQARLFRPVVAGVGSAPGGYRLDQGVQALRSCCGCGRLTRRAAGAGAVRAARAGRPDGDDSSRVLLPLVPTDLGPRSAEALHQLHAGARPVQHRRPTVKAQIAELQYAGVRVGIASWFGPGSLTTDANWPALFQAAEGTGFTWAPYYESGGHPTRRRPRSREICTTCARPTAAAARARDDAGAAHARVRLQRRRP